MRELSDKLGTTQSAVSHQLSMLKSNHLVCKRRQGKQIYYTLADRKIGATIETVRENLGQHRINAKNRIIQWVPNKNCE